MRQAIVGLGSLLILTTWMAAELIETVQLIELNTIGRELSRTVSLHLPAQCGRYYNDGTERWIECMGVGYVREEDDEHD